MSTNQYELKTFIAYEQEALEKLIKRDRWLDHLEDAGVDNWEGISFAYDLMQTEGRGLVDFVLQATEETGLDVSLSIQASKGDSEATVDLVVKRPNAIEGSLRDH